MLEEGKVKLGEAAVVGKEKLGQAAILAGPTYRQTVPEALGGGYPVKAAVIKDEQGNVLNETQPSFLERAKQTYLETAPESLGGRPALEGEKTFTERAQEKIGDFKERIQPTTSTSTQPGLLGLVKQTITEVIPEMIGLKAIREDSEVKLDTERSPDARLDRDIQQVRVTEEIRKVDMDQAGNVTQVETTQNVSHVPIVVTDIPVEHSTLVRPVEHVKPVEHLQKVEDFPINEQPVLERPLTDNYEFQGQSMPAPTSHKVSMPSPQIMTSPQQQRFQGSTFH
jgi:hypothetical protein